MTSNGAIGERVDEILQGRNNSPQILAQDMRNNFEGPNAISRGRPNQGGDRSKNRGAKGPGMAGIKNQSFAQTVAMLNKQRKMRMRRNPLKAQATRRGGLTDQAPQPMREAPPAAPRLLP